ncbi:MAG: LytTR family DNA-binding domain-containing protein [Acidobacteriota bacterium]|nr:LytTR family DNA-binding domain-containing protein [Acidobacteriota bacterium]
MEKIRTLIVDDEPIARRGICQQLRTETDVEIIGECANGREAVEAIRKDSPDLVFLDVQMPLLDGFGVVSAIGAEDLPPVVFVTAYDEHAIRAFEVNALDYLLKPIDQGRFQKTLNRIRRQRAVSKPGQLQQKLVTLLHHLQESQAAGAQSKYSERIVIKESGRAFFLSVDEIYWINAQGNYVQIHAKDSAYLLRETMNSMESKLDPQKFLRIRRSTIVCVDQIKEMQPLFNGEYAVILKDATQLTSSRRYRNNVASLLLN